MNGLKEKYIKEIIPALRDKFGYGNNLAVPKIEKVVVNTGVGRYFKEEKELAEIKKSLGLITGQVPIATFARKAVSSFKIRIGMPIGLKVTLRGERMYDFLIRLISVALPRIRDFRGLDPKSIDKSGNLTIGIKEHTVFPEFSGEETKTIFGLEITVVSTAENKEEGLELFRLMGFPIKMQNAN